MVVCRTHGANCKKYPDHPVVRERNKPDSWDQEFAEMVRAGRAQLGIPAPEYPRECKTRKLSDEEIRQRREYAVTVREARKKNQLPPRPPWEKKLDPELERMVREGRARQARERHTQDVREGYGNAVPDFEEME